MKDNLLNMFHCKKVLSVEVFKYLYSGRDITLKFRKSKFQSKIDRIAN